ncbi:glycosyltransferase family 2 protein [Luteimonas sp. R10]|uniref:glycosyltransferase family 2 protein n=1 Tax=Luteimonas sp. R10 TaxID=3108176 RepID=UPI00308C5966|nr:glycosyltransferase [Luteimonas sp. R10]
MHIRKVSVVIPMYQNATSAIALVNALRNQRGPQNVETEIIVIDDGSGDDSSDRVEAAVGALATMCKLSKNHGRAAARNHAAAKANGDVILFVDCDCLPAGGDLIVQHLRRWTDGVVASIGPVQGDGRGFWHRYQSDASERRARQHAAGIDYSGSSQNMMVARWAFNKCGGFDSLYRAYGFEDRDLQIRLSALGQIAWTYGGAVRHVDALSLRTVSKKMLEAGEHSSTRFAGAHPEAYRALGYASLDVRQRSWLRLPAMLADTFCDALARLGDAFLGSRLIPYGVKRTYVRAITGISYLAGTARALRSGSEALST